MESLKIYGNHSIFGSGMVNYIDYVTVNRKNGTFINFSLCLPFSDEIINPSLGSFEMPGKRLSHEGRIS